MSVHSSAETKPGVKISLRFLITPIHRECHTFAAVPLLWVEVIERSNDEMMGCCPPHGCWPLIVLFMFFLKNSKTEKSEKTLERKQKKKQSRTTIDRVYSTMDSNTLFTSPKRGGILQSSHFLDLKSLMALSRTCKSNAFDELSLIRLIEDELTLFHEVSTIQEAIALWKKVYRNRLLRQWLERCDSSRWTIPREMLFVAASYEVMLGKMLRTIPGSEMLQLVEKQDVLHRAAFSGNVASIRTIFNQFTESEYLHLLSVKNGRDQPVLHCATKSENCEAIKYLLGIIPESHHLQVVSMQDADNMTALHHAARSMKHCESSMKMILTSLPEWQRLQVVNAQEIDGMTALHFVVRSGNIAALSDTLALLPESQRLQAVSVQDITGKTALHCAAISDKHEAVPEILSLLPESQRVQAMGTRDRNGSTVLHEVISSDKLASFRAILTCFPESQHLQVMSLQDQRGRTILHWAAGAGELEAIKTIMDAVPASEHLPLLSVQDKGKRTVLHFAARSRHPDSVRFILTLLPESQRLQAVNMHQDQKGSTVLDLMRGATVVRNAIMQLLAPCDPSPNGTSDNKRLYSTLQHQEQETEGGAMEQPEAKRTVTLRMLATQPPDMP